MVFIRFNIFVICSVVECKHAERKDMDVNNEHERLSNFTFRHKLKYQTSKVGFTIM
jgi:hypothetical protein